MDFRGIDRIQYLNCIVLIGPYSRGPIWPSGACVLCVAWRPGGGVRSLEGNSENITKLKIQAPTR